MLLHQKSMHMSLLLGEIRSNVYSGSIRIAKTGTRAQNGVDHFGTVELDQVSFLFNFPGNVPTVNPNIQNSGATNRDTSGSQAAYLTRRSHASPNNSSNPLKLKKSSI